MKRSACLLPALALLVGCSAGGIPLIVGRPTASPSEPPRIVSATPPFVASPTPSETAAEATASSTAGSTAIPSMATPTTTFGLLLGILGCNTSLDITHQMGEVTNAFPRLQNAGETELTGICATLSASDEAREHPDKTACIPSLAAGSQVVLKLTVDTGFRQDTSIEVEVSSDQGSASVSSPSCVDIGMPGWVPEQVGRIEPIP